MIAPDRIQQVIDSAAVAGFKLTKASDFRVSAMSEHSEARFIGGPLDGRVEPMGNHMAGYESFWRIERRTANCVYSYKRASSQLGDSDYVLDRVKRIGADE